MTSEGIQTSGRILLFACDCVSHLHGAIRDPWSYVSRAGLISSETKEIILNKTYRQPKTVTQLAKEIGLSQPAIHKHVGELLASDMMREAYLPDEEKSYRVEKAKYDEESNRSEVQAELARTLQEKITNQDMTAQDVQIEVVAKQKQIAVQEQEVQRRARELEATVEKPAEAEKYRIETLANARKYQIETEAAGEAESTRLRGKGEADATKARGLAEAEVIQAQGYAEAEAMEKKALAWQKYNQAAIIQQLIEALPQVAGAIAQPLAQTDRIVIINSGGGDGAGASKVTADVTNIVAQVPATLEALTGVDLVQALQTLPGIGQKQTAQEEEGSDS